MAKARAKPTPSDRETPLIRFSTQGLPFRRTTNYRKPVVGRDVFRPAWTPILGVYDQGFPSLGSISDRIAQSFTSAKEESFRFIPLGRWFWSTHLLAIDRAGTRFSGVRPPKNAWLLAPFGSE